MEEDKISCPYCSERNAFGLFEYLSFSLHIQGHKEVDEKTRAEYLGSVQKYFSKFKKPALQSSKKKKTKENRSERLKKLYERKTKIIKVLKENDLSMNHIYEIHAAGNMAQLNAYLRKKLLQFREIFEENQIELPNPPKPKKNKKSSKKNTPSKKSGSIRLIYTPMGNKR